jgi:hypothetical protein
METVTSPPFVASFVVNFVEKERRKRRESTKLQSSPKRFDLARATKFTTKLKELGCRVPFNFRIAASGSTLVLSAPVTSLLHTGSGRPLSVPLEELFLNK